jgi:hypothetical protein
MQAFPALQQLLNLRRAAEKVEFRAPGLKSGGVRGRVGEGGRVGLKRTALLLEALWCCHRDGRRGDRPGRPRHTRVSCQAAQSALDSTQRPFDALHDTVKTHLLNELRRTLATRHKSRTSHLGIMCQVVCVNQLGEFLVGLLELLFRFFAHLARVLIELVREVFHTVHDGRCLIAQPRTPGHVLPARESAARER